VCGGGGARRVDAFVTQGSGALRGAGRVVAGLTGMVRCLRCRACYCVERMPPSCFAQEMRVRASATPLFSAAFAQWSRHVPAPDFSSPELVPTAIGSW